MPAAYSLQSVTIKNTKFQNSLKKQTLVQMFSESAKQRGWCGQCSCLDGLGSVGAWVRGLRGSNFGVGDAGDMTTFFIEQLRPTAFAF